MLGKYADSGYRWIPHFWTLDVGSDLGLRYMSSDFWPFFGKHTIWHDPDENWNKSVQVS